MLESDEDLIFDLQVSSDDETFITEASLQPRSKKRRPSFRRLLKTSGVKLENKLKNRQLKQQNVAKKQRKEQKKLRHAVKDAVIRMPRPLETYRKRPEEEEDEEEFLEALPTDMMEDDDLQQMASMAHEASFITRDLSSCGPVHSGKKRRSEVVRSYEKVPRKMTKTEEKEVIHLLPIKDKTGVIPQSMERVKKWKEEEEAEEAEEAVEQAKELEDNGELQSTAELTEEQREELRVQKIKEKKLCIATLGSAIISDPFTNLKRVKELRGMLMESDPCVAVTVKKDTQQLREFEEGLVSQYKFYLEDLEQIIKDWKQQKKKRSQAVGFSSYLSLAEVAVRCLCELLLALPHFNFHNNIIVILVPLMNDPVNQVSCMCCDAFKKLFQQDKLGGASLATVRVISGLVKRLNYNVKPEVLRTLLSLRIKEVEMKKDIEATAPKKKFMNNKEKKKNLSRMQRKWKKAEEKLEKELLEAEASESKDKKIKLDLTNRESLHCIQTVFTILSGQGDVLNIDPLNFYSQLYKMLPTLHAGKPNGDIIIVLRCLDGMLIRRRKQVTLQRAMAFVKRLSTLSLHVLPNAGAGILAANRAAMHSFPKCDFLLDNEVQGSGFYLPELDEPEHCNAQNTALWELHTLQRHYHPVVRQFAVHLSLGAPSEGSAALSVDLSRRSPAELFDDYSVRDMTFNPAVAAPGIKKRDHFTAGASLLDAELQRQAESVLTVSTETELDFSTAHALDIQ
ncbi:hypothetical protein PAMP_009857 [Pampus punctatissimus]